ncbi:MbtH family protein [Solihabitans fulvus]|uniref:MbtH family protein n=1 Tax=Solihabitans fulvus TaxID=1892852 RepID=A0A5B2WVB5_9PSEU|nr:MbtH family protein [Solihabitans fulvus]KAA2254439.1 MbtH family protein [Solihabitans fulvus]
MTDSVRYKVLVNDEEQYSTWPAHRANPLGWHDCGPVGTRQECLAHIAEVWTDLTPRSARRSSGSDAGHTR